MSALMVSCEMLTESDNASRETLDRQTAPAASPEGLWQLSGAEGEPHLEEVIICAASRVIEQTQAFEPPLLVVLQIIQALLP